MSVPPGCRKQPKLVGITAPKFSLAAKAVTVSSQSESRSMLRCGAMQ